jgi:hypothetical protein
MGDTNRPPELTLRQKLKRMSKGAKISDVEPEFFPELKRRALSLVIGISLAAAALFAVACTKELIAWLIRWARS